MTQKYHKILGVSKKAGIDEIKKAFRRLAMQFHPDRNKSPEAESRFKEINQAYAILSGKEKAPQEPLKRHENWKPETGNRKQMDPWSASVARIWMRMESEKHNNMYF